MALQTKVIKIIKFPLTYFSLAFIIASGFGSMFSGMFGPVPEGYGNYGSYLEGLTFGLVAGTTIGLFLYWSIFGISAFFYSLLPLKIHLFLRIVFLLVTIILGYATGMIIARGLAI